MPAAKTGAAGTIDSERNAIFCRGASCGGACRKDTPGKGPTRPPTPVSLMFEMWTFHGCQLRRLAPPASVSFTARERLQGLKFAGAAHPSPLAGEWRDGCLPETARPDSDGQTHTLWLMH